MSKRKSLTVIIMLISIFCGVCIADELEDNWGSFLHYTKIGRLDLAKDYGQAVIDSKPDAVTVLGFVEGNPQAILLLNKAAENSYDADLAKVARGILSIIDEGTFAKRTESAIIAEEVRRLSGTARGRVTAVDRLKNAGEYAIPFMVDAMSDETRRSELANIIWALPQIGNDAIRPLATALDTDNLAVKAEIIKAMGLIGYPQSLGYLKYVVENDPSSELRSLAAASIGKIEPAAVNIPAAELFYRLAESYYYHNPSLAPEEDADFGNIWFWDAAERRLVREQVSRDYFYELMAMRSCEWALRADGDFGKAIGMWIAAYFKAESAKLPMPAYFGPGHADAKVYATTAGPEYLHQALSRAIKDRNAYVALAAIEAMAENSGEASLMYRLNMEQPLLAALSFDDKAVRYSAAIVIASAKPRTAFGESRLVVQNLAETIRENSSSQVSGMWNGDMADDYAMRAAAAMLQLASIRNQAVNLAPAQAALIEATKDDRIKLRVLAAGVLANLTDGSAQQAIAAMALEQTNSKEIRIAAFGALAESARMNGCKLGDNSVSEMYGLISSTQTDADLREAAASAYGALNLPSAMVKDLILSQAKK